MNDRLGWENEATSRAINAESWEPMHGMEKRQCPACRYFFAVPPDVGEVRCPDCVSLGRRPGARQEVDGLPTRDGADALPRLHVVGDTWEQPP